MVGRADIEFYYSALVLTVAHTFATKRWDQLSYRSKQRLLDKAVDILHDLLNSTAAQEQLRIFLTSTSKELDFP
jgi:hypothetical protein